MAFHEPNVLTDIKCAIDQYAKAYLALEGLQDRFPDWLPKGDQKTGIIGEFYAKVYLAARYPGAEIHFGGHSQTGWDLVVKQEQKIKVQVKTVSAHSSSRRLTPIHPGWDVLYLMYLGRDLCPKGFWVIDDPNIIPDGGELIGKKMPLPGNPRTGSREFANRKDQLDSLLDSLRY